VTQDSIGLADGLNLYQRNLNPVTWVDALGLVGCAILKSNSMGHDYYSKLKNLNACRNFGISKIR